MKKQPEVKIVRLLDHQKGLLVKLMRMRIDFFSELPKPPVKLLNGKKGSFIQVWNLDV